MRSKESRPDRNELARLLNEAGSAYDPEGIEILIEGVLAAPAEVGTSWHVLVADPITAGLADQLEATLGHLRRLTIDNAQLRHDLEAARRITRLDPGRESPQRR